MNQHIDEDRGQNPHHDAELIKSDAAPANARRRNLRDVVGRNHRGSADADSANQPPEHKLIEVRGKKHSDRRQRKAKSAERKPLLLSEEISNSPRSGTAGDASNERAPRGPTNARGIQMKALAQIADRAADHDVVVTKEQAAQSRHTGGDEQRPAGMRGGPGAQVSLLLNSEAALAIITGVWERVASPA